MLRRNLAVRPAGLGRKKPTINDAAMPADDPCGGVDAAQFPYDGSGGGRMSGLHAAIVHNVHVPSSIVCADYARAHARPALQASRMDTKWFNEKLKQAGVTQDQLAAAIHRDRSVVSRILNGKVKLSLHALPAFARALRVSPAEVIEHAGGNIEGAEEEEAPSPSKTWTDGFTPKPMDIPQEAELPRDLPVYGTAVGGNEGAFELNGQLHEMVARPSYLATVRNAYAIYMTGSSMEPALSSGWLLHVHPTKPPAPGSFVVVQLRNPDDHQPVCFVKQFVRRDATKLVCRQYNPATEIEWPLDQVIAVHRVVGIADM